MAATKVKNDRPVSDRWTPCLETLEDRLLMAFNPSAVEQEMLEHVNRMRQNPSGELSVLVDSLNPIHSADADVNAALDYFNVSGTTLANQWASLSATAPLAWNADLYAAAKTHSQNMKTADMQSHQLPGEASLGTRITAAGYTNWSNIGENVFAYAESAFHGHAGFAIDWGTGSGGIQNPAGHRINIMNPAYTEIGIGIITDTNNATSVGPYLITQDFGNRFDLGDHYLLGHVRMENNGDSLYNAGEGLGGVTITIVGSAGSVQTSTMTAGGYQLQLAPGSYTVTASGGGLADPVTKNVMIGSQNVKVDFVINPNSGGSGTGGSTGGSGGETGGMADSSNLPVSDAFNRGDSTSLGSSWTEKSGDLAIQNGQVKTLGGANGVATVIDVSARDVSVSADVFVKTKSKSKDAGVVARADVAGNMYYAGIFNNGKKIFAKLYSVVGGNATLLAKSKVASANGTIQLDVVGNSISVGYQGTQVIAGTDSSVTGEGTVGIRGLRATLDNFSASEIVTPSLSATVEAESDDPASPANEASGPQGQPALDLAFIRMDADLPLGTSSPSSRSHRRVNPARPAEGQPVATIREAFAHTVRQGKGTALIDAAFAQLDELFLSI